MALARLSLVKSGLFLGLTTTDLDELCKAALRSCSMWAEKECNRTLMRATITDERHSGDAGINLWPRQYPVVSLTSVSIYDGSAFTAETNSYFEIINSEMLQYPKQGAENLSTYEQWPEPDREGRFNIKITYVAGYDDTGWDSLAYTSTGFGVPYDLEDVVARLVALAIKDGHAGEARLGISAQNIGNQTFNWTKFQKGMSDKDCEILAGYRRPDF